MAATGDESPPSSLRRQQRPSFMSPGLSELVSSPLKVGFYSGTAGALAGVAGAIARDTSPVASGLLSGAQWFMLGSSYWFTRTVGIKAYGGEERMTSMDKVAVSTLAGSTAGALSGLTRGPTRILPSIILCGLLGAGGQAMANRSSASRPAQGTDNGSGWLSKLSPLKKLSDEEYIDMMKEKILKVEVDIALIDDRIAELRAAEKEQAQQGGDTP